MLPAHGAATRSAVPVAPRRAPADRAPGRAPRHIPRMIRNTVWLAASALAWLVAVAFGQEPRPSTMAHRSTVYAPHGMIATSQPLATAAGLAVLGRGGNAIDAAVTAAAAPEPAAP